MFFSFLFVGLSKLSNLDTHTTPKKQSGFSLIELLIAVSIFAMIALATGAMFATVKSSNDLSQQSLGALQQAQRTMLILERDFLQMIARAPRVQGQQNKVVLSGGDFEFESDEGSIAFVRNGWHNPQMMLPRSSIQRVIYSLQENVLIRQHFNHVDTVIGAEPKSRELLQDISDFEVEVAYEKEDGELVWENDFEGEGLPIAVRVALVSDVFGKVERIFQVAP